LNAETMPDTVPLRACCVSCARFQKGTNGPDRGASASSTAGRRAGALLLSKEDIRELGPGVPKSAEKLCGR
jgi:hypothetical protein